MLLQSATKEDLLLKGNWWGALQRHQRRLAQHGFSAGPTIPEAESVRVESMPPPPCPPPLPRPVGERVPVREPFRGEKGKEKVVAHPKPQPEMQKRKPSPPRQTSNLEQRKKRKQQTPSRCFYKGSSSQYHEYHTTRETQCPGYKGYKPRNYGKKPGVSDTDSTLGLSLEQFMDIVWTSLWMKWVKTLQMWVYI